MYTRFLPCLLLSGLAACAAPAARELRASSPPAYNFTEPDSGSLSGSAVIPQSSSGDSRQYTRPIEWRPGQTLMQGFFGASLFERVEVDGGGPGEVDGDDGELDQIPLLGGGGQFKTSGENIDFGLEGMISFGWRGNAEAFVIGGGGAAVAVDVDLFLIDLFGGPFVSKLLAEKLRVYGAAGPLFQFADYTQTGNGLSEDGSGFGFGWYARTGFEFALASHLMIGLGVRWSDSSMDLGGSLEDLELEGLQTMITVSSGL
jgi:opacity protein-like surface antigen